VPLTVAAKECFSSCFYGYIYAIFYVFTAVKIQVQIFWAVTPCTCSRVKIKAENSSEKPVPYSKTTRHRSSEDLDFHLKLNYKTFFG
jgi:hypothetical protein